MSRRVMASSVSASMLEFRLLQRLAARELTTIHPLLRCRLHGLAQADNPIYRTERNPSWYGIVSGRVGVAVAV